LTSAECGFKTVRAVSVIEPGRSQIDKKAFNDEAPSLERRDETPGANLFAYGKYDISKNLKIITRYRYRRIKNDELLNFLVTSIKKEDNNKVVCVCPKEN
jgi:hypothetical protein